MFRGGAGCLRCCYEGNKRPITKDLIHERPNAMHILIPNLHKNRTGIVKQIPRSGEAIAEVGQVAVDAIAPSVAECFYLFWLAGDVFDLAVLHVAAGSRPLKVAVEPDAIRRVDIDALYPGAQTLP